MLTSQHRPLDPSSYPHNVGYVAPNVTINFGADFTITPRLVATTRFGYYFENYGDRGYPTNSTLFIWQTRWHGCAIRMPRDNAGQSTACLVCSKTSGFFNDPYSGTFTRRNSNKAIQYDADLAWFKSGWGGTHNFKFGYQLNRLQNDILQSYNEPYVQLFVGTGSNGSYAPLSDNGVANLRDSNVPVVQTELAQAFTAPPTCLTSALAATSPASTTDCLPRMPGRSVMASPSMPVFASTRNICRRVRKPALTSNPINFGWGDKVAPRIGAAWDVFKDGRMKVFGSYGKFFDIMKLNVAISSFGGQYWNNCEYTLDTSDLASIVPALNSAGRYCVGLADGHLDRCALGRRGDAGRD